MVQRKSRNEKKIEAMTNNDSSIRTIDDEDISKSFEEQWKESNSGGKASLGIELGFRTIFKIIEDFVVFIIAAFSIIYLYWKFETKEAGELFPNDPMKFPYVFFDDKKDSDKQNNMTSSVVDENANFDELFYKIVGVKTNENGNVNNGATKAAINQPDDATIGKMSKIGSFFNFASQDKTSSDINFIQLVAYALISGVIGVQGFFGQLHNIAKSLYLKEDQTDGNKLLKYLGYMMSFILFVFVFYLFKMSKYDFSSVTMPILRTDSSEFDESVFGIQEIINIFSSLFSGFFSIFKIIFFISYIAFIFNVIISLLRVNGNLTNSSTLILSYLMIFTFFSNFLIFSASFINAIRKAPEMNSVANQIFIEILNTVKKSVFSFKNVSGKRGNSFLSKMFNVDNINMGSMTSLLMFVLSLPIIIAFIPLMLMPIVFIILGIVMTFIPFIGSIFTSTGITYDFTMKGIYNWNSIKSIMRNNLIIMALAYLLISLISINNIRKKGTKIFHYIETITFVVFSLALMVGMFIARSQIKNQLKNEPVKATPVVVAEPVEETTAPPTSKNS